MHDYVAYRSAFLLSGFITSFAMYPLCHVLWSRRIALLPTLSCCVVASYFLGVLCSAAASLAEIHFGGLQMAFHWDSAFASATGSGFVLLAWSGFYFGIHYYYALEEQRARLLLSETLAREAQLRALRYQLQPHFLFNTLNAISTLVLDNQPRIATQMISRLADLLRSTLDSPDVHQVALIEEVAIAEEYLAIEKIRLGPRLEICIEIADTVRDVQVPRFLLQPLVENAVRHGIARRAQGGRIFIRAYRGDSHLFMRIENEGPQGSCRDFSDISTPNAGVGLANSRARLDQIYGSSAVLETDQLSDGSFAVSISIPLYSAESATDELVIQSNPVGMQ